MKSPMLPMPYSPEANMSGSAAQKLEIQIQNLAVHETFATKHLGGNSAILGEHVVNFRVRMSENRPFDAMFVHRLRNM